MEAQGIATTQISLIREHSEKIKPPRALWVPFPLGRPLGKAGDAAFQKDVLLAALKLLERDSGPILEDYPYDANDNDDAAPMACPVSFVAPAPPQDDIAILLSRFHAEVVAMQTWFNLAKEKSGRTTAGISGLDIEAIAALFADLVEKGRLQSPVEGQTPADTLIRGSEDLLANYFEAASVQPGQTNRPEARRLVLGGNLCRQSAE